MYTVQAINNVELSMKLNDEADKCEHRLELIPKMAVCTTFFYPQLTIDIKSYNLINKARLSIETSKQQNERLKGFSL